MEDGDILPIINVGASINSVEYKDQKGVEKGSQENNNTKPSTTSKPNTIGSRTRRRVDSVNTNQ